MQAHLSKKSKIMPRTFLVRKPKPPPVNYQKKWTNIDTTAPLFDELLCNYAGILPQLSEYKAMNALFKKFI